MSRSKGILHALVAYVCWGFFPFYWKQVAHVPAEQVMSHRIWWSFVSIAVFVALRGQLRNVIDGLRIPGVLRIYAGAATLIGINWYCYIWGVNNNLIVETALGYFINPLLTVLMGVIFFRERLRPLQWCAIALAAAGVLYLAVSYGRLPWLALTIALSFSLYSAVKKKAPLEARTGLAVETMTLAPLALAFLLFEDRQGVGAWGHIDTATTAYLTGAGIVTTTPLLLFASAVQAIPLSVSGLMFYINPTLQFLCGVVVYGEPFTMDQRIGFGAVWAGCVLFGIDASGMREPSALKRSRR